MPIKKEKKKLQSIKLIRQTRDTSHEIEITTWKVNHNKP
jgi:hypothetical protein